MDDREGAWSLLPQEKTPAGDTGGFHERTISIGGDPIALNNKQHGAPIVHARMWDFQNF